MHQFPGSDILIQHIGLDGIDHFCQIMRRYTGCHTYRDTFRTVDQQIGNFYRQNIGFPLCLIKIGNEIHHIFVQIGQKSFLGNAFQPCLRITHSGSAIPLNITKVAVAVNQGQSPFEILGHDYQRFIDGTVSMRMVFTHGIPYDTR